jgi:iron complex outermembrane recepter protein
MAITSFLPNRARSRCAKMFFCGVFVSGLMASMALAEQETAPTGAAPADKPVANDVQGILNMDIEQLGKVDVSTPSMNLEVTSVSKQESTVGKSPAAIYVLTDEMIKRAGVNNIPDALRLVPGVQVAQCNANSWAITIRGNNSRYNNRLLVLIDGRSVYQQVTGAVYWDQQDMLLEDIDRIEVIRGPGGTLWGDNAFSGVINIITKKAKDTQGALVTYGGGTEDLALGGARYGGKIGENLNYRIYGKHREEAAGYLPTGPGNDDWRQGRGGFRADWEPDKDKSNTITVQGDYYTGDEGIFGDIAAMRPVYHRTIVEDEAVQGANVLARWSHVIDEESDWMFLTYWDRAQRDTTIWNQDVSNFDAQFQHHFPLGRRQEIIWGAEYRMTHDEEQCDGFVINFDPAEKTTSLFNMFVQDQLTVVEDRLYFIAGSKLERNPYTGFEYQPSGRVLYTPDNKHSYWAAISRAVALPNRYEYEGWYTTPAVRASRTMWVFPRRIGNPDLTSEKELCFEVGYRAQPVKEFSYDVTLFYNDLRNGRAGSSGTMFVDPYGNIILPIQNHETSEGQTYGMEIFGERTMSERWRLSAGYTYLYYGYSINRNPPNQFSCMSSWKLGKNWNFDLVGRYVDRLKKESVPAYLTMDAQLTWRPRKHLEFALIGRNLFDPYHYEFGKEDFPYFVTEVERSVFGKVTYQY